MATTSKKGKAFGNVQYSFKGQTVTVEQLFGTEPIPPTVMTKKIWDFVKANKLRVE